MNTDHHTRSLDDGLRLAVGAILAALRGESAAPLAYAVHVTTEPEDRADVFTAAFLAAVSLVPLAAEAGSPDNLADVLSIEATSLAARATT